MPRSRSLSALVLRTYDVGEADRFCILLTPEEGRLTARAAGVRRLTSRMGAALIPFAEVTLLLKESSAGNIVASAERAAHEEPLSLSAFAQASEGVELLLRLLQDGEAIAGVFPLTLEFFSACRLDVPDAFVRFGLRLLFLLGLLPGTEQAKHLKKLSLDDEAFFERVRSSQSHALWTDSLPVSPAIAALFTFLVRDHLSAPLKAQGIGELLR